MEKLKILFKLGLKFEKAFFTQYSLLLLEPLKYIIVGVLCLLLMFIHPVLALVSLFVATPLLCYGILKGYILTHYLNYAAVDFLKASKRKNIILKNYKSAFFEKDFIKYISFCAVLTLLFFIPVLYKFIKTATHSGVYALTDLNNVLNIIVLALLISLLLIPFTNYLLQAYIFKKNNENYFHLFLNCYKKLDWIGFLIAFLFTIISLILSAINPIFLIFLMFLNPFIYSINTFWYYSRK